MMMAGKKILPVVRLGMDTSVKTEVFPPTGDFNMIYHCTATFQFDSFTINCTCAT